MIGHKESNDRERGALRKALPLPFIFAAIVATAFFSFSGRVGRAEKALCSGVASHAAGEVNKAVGGFLDFGSVLSSKLEKNPALGKDEIAAISGAILESHPFVTGVSAAPSAIVKYHFPETGNESLIGHDLLSNPERRDALTRAVELKSPVISGPFESVEGGAVLFARYPVFSEGKLWGFTSLTMNFDRMVEAFGLEEEYPGYIFAFSGESGDGEQADTPQSDTEKALAGGAAGSGNFLAGAKAAFSTGAISEAIRLPGAVWRLHVMPAKGWTSADSYLYILFAAGIVGAAALFVIFYSRALGKNERAERAVQNARAAKRGDSGSGGIAGRGGEPTPFAEAVRAAREMKSSRSISLESGSFPAAAIETKAAARPTEEGEIPVGAPATASAADAARYDGTEVKFKGQDVRGQLYMPDVLFSGDPSILFAQPSVRREETQGIAPPPKAREHYSRETEPEAKKTRRPPERRQEFLFSLEEEPKNSDTAILVVDDSEANRDIMGRMLSLRGYKPDFAASGEEALSLCSDRDYAIIFMDCFMPDMDGYKTSSLLRAAHPTSACRIVGMSARIGDQELGRCKTSGMSDLLPKPFTLKQLLSYIEKA